MNRLLHFLGIDLQFIKSTRYQIRSVNIKSILFFRYSVVASLLESYGISLSGLTKNQLSKPSISVHDAKSAKLTDIKLGL